MIGMPTTSCELCRLQRRMAVIPACSNHANSSCYSIFTSCPFAAHVLVTTPYGSHGKGGQQLLCILHRLHAALVRTPGH